MRLDNFRDKNKLSPIPLSLLWKSGMWDEARYKLEARAGGELPRQSGAKKKEGRGDIKEAPSWSETRFKSLGCVLVLAITHHMSNVFPSMPA